MRNDAAPHIRHGTRFVRRPMEKFLSVARSASTSNRKREQLSIVLNEDVEFKEVTTGFENYRFVHQALPEVDLAQVDATTALFGKKLGAPLLISSMIGGIHEATRINLHLAEAAQALGLAMAVGSQRCAVDDESSALSYKVRAAAPDILLFANLGAVQLNNGYDVDECRRSVEMIGADALILHLNPLQEALQIGGNTNFSGLLHRIELICRKLPAPVVIKEVGCGISDEVARKLISAGVAGIDVSGAGGTSWSEVERFRNQTRMGNNIAAAFASWGIPTSESLIRVHRQAAQAVVIASGGISSGLDVAKAIALGADAAGIARPLLKAATVSAEAVMQLLSEVIETIKIAMFCIGASCLSELKCTPLLMKTASAAVGER